MADISAWNMAAQVIGMVMVIVCGVCMIVSFYVACNNIDRIRELLEELLEKEDKNL